LRRVLRRVLFIPSCSIIQSHYDFPKNLSPAPNGRLNRSRQGQYVDFLRPALD
jgi:hypothetical protein